MYNKLKEDNPKFIEYKRKYFALVENLKIETIKLTEENWTEVLKAKLRMYYSLIDVVKKVICIFLIFFLYDYDVVLIYFIMLLCGLNIALLFYLRGPWKLMTYNFISVFNDFFFIALLILFLFIKQKDNQI